MGIKLRDSFILRQSWRGILLCGVPAEFVRRSAAGDVKFMQELQLTDSDRCACARVRVCSRTRDAGADVETNSDLLTS